MDSPWGFPVVLQKKILGAADWERLHLRMADDVGGAAEWIERACGHEYRRTFQWPNTLKV